MQKGDVIYRQQAIDALDKHIDTFDAIDTNYLCGLRTAMSILKEMPSAQPETHDKRTETHACDCISRQAAIDKMQMFIDSLDKESPAYKSLSIAFDRCIIELKRMPSAQTEPCEDAVSREAVIAKLKDMRKHGDMIPWEGKRVFEAIRHLPSAQPERKKWKWIDGRCSICGCDIPAYIIDWKWQKDMDANYCPSCGADMRGESE